MYRRQQPVAAGYQPYQQGQPPAGRFRNQNVKDYRPVEQDELFPAIPESWKQTCPVTNERRREFAEWVLAVRGFAGDHGWNGVYTTLDRMHAVLTERPTKDQVMLDNERLKEEIEQLKKTGGEK